MRCPTSISSRTIGKTAIATLTLVVLILPYGNDAALKTLAYGNKSGHGHLFHWCQGLISGRILAALLFPKTRFDGTDPDHRNCRRASLCMLLMGVCDVLVKPWASLAVDFEEDFSRFPDVFWLALWLTSWMFLYRPYRLAPAWFHRLYRGWVLTGLPYGAAFMGFAAAEHASWGDAAVVGLRLATVSSWALHASVLASMLSYRAYHNVKREAAARAELSAAHGQSSTHGHSIAQRWAGLVPLEVLFRSVLCAATFPPLHAAHPGLDLLLSFALSFHTLLAHSILAREPRDMEAVQEQLAEEARLATIWRARAAGGGLQSEQRVAFHGRVHEAADACVVSFPGKYAAQWDTAVQFAREFLSLACVFLTDETSGLGQHVQNPETPGHCYCTAIYGSVPVEAYATFFEESPNSEGYAKKLAFAMADSNAMGTLLLLKGHMGEEDWHQAKRRALEEAGRRHRGNGGVAPWGCRWFHAWKQNVDEAVRSNQRLRVYYFEGKCGYGKVPWEGLSNPEVMKQARLNTGLGASQTAEVAYLDKMGYPYEERDVARFAEDCDELRAAGNRATASSSAAGRPQLARPPTALPVEPGTIGKRCEARDDDEEAPPSRACAGFHECHAQDVPGALLRSAARGDVEPSAPSSGPLALLRSAARGDVEPSASSSGPCALLRSAARENVEPSAPSSDLLPEIYGRQYKKQRGRSTIVTATTSQW